MTPALTLIRRGSAHGWTAYTYRGLSLYRYPPLLNPGPGRRAWPEYWGVASGWGWLPGLTDTAETAITLDRLSTADLHALNEAINYPRPDAEDRPITMDDIRRVRSRVRPAARRRTATAMRRVGRRAARRRVTA